jgi:hypothetical protein
MLVTSSGHNRVLTLNDEPALDVYLRQLNAPSSAGANNDALTQFALTHPLGLSRRVGEEQIRNVAGGDVDERSLLCIAEVPQGALVWIMEGDEESVLDATDGACRDSLMGLDGHTPIGMIAFDCAARRSVLGESGIKLEIDRVAANAGGAPVAGLYTYGEIARIRGMNGFYNQTLVVLSVA